MKPEQWGGMQRWNGAGVLKYGIKQRPLVLGTAIGLQILAETPYKQPTQRVPSILYTILIFVYTRAVNKESDPAWCAPPTLSTFKILAMAAKPNSPPRNPWQKRAMYLIYT